MKSIFNKTQYIAASLLIPVALLSCKKDAEPQVTEVAESNLVAKFSFEDNFTDLKSGTSGTANGVNFVDGIKGKAYQGSPGGFVSFANTPAGLASLESFTTSMWIRTARHTGGIQGVFTIPGTTSYFGNMLVMIDQNNTTSDSMNMKVYFEKNVVPAIGWYGQYIDLYGEYRLPNMYDNWNQVTFMYDATTSKFAAYLNGNKLVLEEGITDRFTDDPNDGGQLLGALSFANVSKFILGGYQNHLGAPWDAPDSEMLTYTGAMDELRFYNRALTATEVKALYNLDSGH
ncbi:MAG TPA: LamG-like jellyroll fold domain-containing protein [Flavisolibacter sp.]